ncbi:MAG TPA: polyphosphate kinase 2 family protein [Methanomicrobiales archaeon]|nr:polyphosphate kinase 2 family protein [Methanomicrobiales archaeon]
MADPMDQVLDKLRVPPGRKVSLRQDFDPGYTGHFTSKADAKETLRKDIDALADLQYKLYAQDTYALLLVLQGLDAAGKDSTIRHVMSGVNPQGVQVTSFKVPSTEELDHDFLWRHLQRLPGRGNIGIFNRSYYEEVLIVRVHREFLDRQHIPAGLKGKTIWKRRFLEINNFEKYLGENGIVLLKCLLNVSKEEQKRQFLERIENPEKSWKFSASDIKERRYWDHYQDAFDDMLSNTSTEWAPWYVIPADHRWFTRLAVVSLLLRTMKALDLHYPEITPRERRALLAGKKEMEQEEGEARRKQRENQV